MTVSLALRRTAIRADPSACPGASSPIPRVSDWMCSCVSCRQEPGRVCRVFGPVVSVSAGDFVALHDCPPFLTSHGQIEVDDITASISPDANGGCEVWLWWLRVKVVDRCRAEGE